MRLPMPFIGEHAEGHSAAVNAQKCVNWYPQMERTGAHNVVSLYPTPGLVDLATGGAGGIRCNGVVWKDNLYFISGAELIKIDKSDITTSIGVMNTSVGRCSIASGRSYLMVVDGKDGWTYDGTTFAQITDGDFPIANYCTWTKGRFIVDSDGTDRFYVSDDDDPTSWQALLFATSQGKADNLRRPVGFHGYLYNFGDETLEVNYPSTNPDFPFEVFQNGILDWGIDAPDSIGETESALCFLSRTKQADARVAMCTGMDVKVISNADIEYQINEQAVTNDGEGFCYTDHGHTFYVLSFPSDSVTYVYDLTTSLWHTRQTGTSGRWDVGGYGFYRKKHIAGDSVTGKFYQLKQKVFTEKGATVTRLRRGHMADSEQRDTFWNRFEILFSPVELVTETGSITAFASSDGGTTTTVTSPGHGRVASDVVVIMGTTSYDGEQTISSVAGNTFVIPVAFVANDATGTWTDNEKRIPKAMLRWSDDAQESWSNEIWADMARVDRRITRTVWNRLGRSYERVYELKITDPVNAIIRDVFADVDVVEHS